MQSKLLLFLIIICIVFFSSSGVPIDRTKLDVMDDIKANDNSTLDTTVAKPDGSSPDNPNPDSSSIDWQPCTAPQFKGWFSKYSQIDLLQCATIEVALPSMTAQPINNDLTLAPESINPAEQARANIDLQASSDTKTSPTIMQLAVSRLPATGNDNQKMGSIISIAGGPGQSGLDVSPYDSQAYEQLSKHFDIIGYAPRGVSPTTPSIICETQPKNDNEGGSGSVDQNKNNDTDPMTNPNSDSNTDDSDKIAQEALDFAQACWDQTPHDLLAHLGADYAVDDIEAIRQALNVPRVNLIGYSYGTKIAALYAEKYPEHLRVGVLDGVVNLNEPEFQMRINQQLATQNTFERFVEYCREHDDCYFADTKTIKEAEKKLARLYLKLEDEKIYDKDNERIYPVDLTWEIDGLLMWSDQWSLLNDLLLELENDDYTFLRYLIKVSKEDINEDTFVSIICADVAPNETQRHEYINETRRIQDLSTWDNYREFSDEELVDGCYYWPIAGSDITHIPKISKAAAPYIPMMLVAQTHDSATPYKNAVIMQDYLDGILVTREGDGHTLALFDDSRCVDEYVVNYFIDPFSFEINQDKRDAQDEYYCYD